MRPIGRGVRVCVVFGALTLGDSETSRVWELYRAKPTSVKQQ